MAAQDHPSQRAPPSRALLRAARRAGCLAQASAARTPCREQEAQGLEIAPFDSGPRSDPRGRADGHCPNTPSLPCQAAALEIQWVWGGDTHECRSPVCQWATRAIEAAGIRAGSRPRSQSPAQVFIQKSWIAALLNKYLTPVTITSSSIYSKVRRSRPTPRKALSRSFTRLW